MYELTRISAPLTMAQKVAVVPVPEMRRHARISQLDDDRLLAEDIEAAYDFLAGEDGWLGRCCLLDETFAAYVKWTQPKRLPGSYEAPEGHDEHRVAAGRRVLRRGRPDQVLLRTR